MAALDLPDALALADAVTQGDRAALASALNLLDDTRAAARDCASTLLSALAKNCNNASARLVGMTGPPGVGKSSLTAALIRHWRTQAQRVGVLAVDPSQPDQRWRPIGRSFTHAGERR